MGRWRRRLIELAALALLTIAVPTTTAHAATAPPPPPVGTVTCVGDGPSFTFDGYGWNATAAAYSVLGGWGPVQVTMAGTALAQVTIPSYGSFYRLPGSVPAGVAFSDPFTMTQQLWVSISGFPIAFPTQSRSISVSFFKDGNVCPPRLVAGTPCLPASGGPLPLSGQVNRRNDRIDVAWDVPPSGPVPHEQVLDNAGSVAADGTFSFVANVPPIAAGTHRFYVGTGSFDGPYYYNPDDSNGKTVYADVVVPCPPAALRISPPSLDLGSTIVGQSSAAKTMTVTNVGSAPAPLGAPTLAGASPGDFALDPAGTCAGATLTPKQSCTVVVRLAPTTTGPLAATVTVASSNGGSASGSLTGTGIETSITITPAPVDFGTLTVATASPPTTLTVTNAGTEALPITSIKVTGANAADFVVDDTGCKGITLAPAGTCALTVVLTPADAGARTATVTVVAGPARAKAPLRGAGIYNPTLVFSPAVVHLGELTTLVGTGFPANRPISFDWLEPDVRPLVPLTTDAAGAFRLVLLMIGGEHLGVRHLQPSALADVLAEPRPIAPLLVQAAPFRPQGANVSRIVAGQRIAIVTRG